MIRKILNYICACNKQHKWARKYLGGKWECWWIDCICSDMWFQVDDWYEVTGKRPGSAFGSPTREDYTNV